MQKNYSGPVRIAHRGVVQAAPENTLGAFEAAFNQGYEGMEIDVQLSRDNEIVVVHDYNLTRLTLGHPSKACHSHIKDLDWEELSRVEIPYANHLLDVDPPPTSKDEFLAVLPERQLGQEHGRSYVEALMEEKRMAKLMRFSGFLEWFRGREADARNAPASRMLVEIEIKAPGMAKKIFDTIESFNAAANCIVFSGVRDYIDELQALAAKEGKPKGLRLGANIRFLDDRVKKEISGMDLFEVGLNAGRCTVDDLLWLADHGVKAFSNLGDYPEWWRQICEMRFLGFKTNYAQAFTGWWHLNEPLGAKNHS